MPQQTDTAVPTRIISVNKAIIGQKLRLAGRMLSYDIMSGLVLLLDRDKAVLVDASLCLNPWSSGWVRERLGVITVVGHLEQSADPLPIPTIPAYAPAPDVDPRLVVSALLIIQAADLDLDLWNLAIEEKEQA